MPHADASIVPSSITTKTEFWAHVHAQLDALLTGQRNWVTNLANAAALIYHSLAAFPAHFGPENRQAWTHLTAINPSLLLAGFYVSSCLLPHPSFRGTLDSDHAPNNSSPNRQLLLGPFCGRPACQFINITPGKARGVCANAVLQRKVLVVPDVDLYPGHIACDGKTKSEIVCPLILPHGETEIVLGVLDLDCLAIAGFDDDDQMGLQKISELIVQACDW